MKIADHVQSLQKRLGSDIDLIVVTKNQSVESIETAVKAGANIIGENRIQEAKEKFPQLDTRGVHVQKHLIGHLQTNKVKDAVQLFDMIQSVDSLRLAQKINEAAAKNEKTMPILVQVNVAEDPHKYGFSIEETEAAITSIAQNAPHVRIEGLMTIVQYEDNIEKTRPYFRKMKTFFEFLKEKRIPGIRMKTLSMGMSHDHPIAVEEGATMVRLGSAIFK